MRNQDVFNRDLRKICIRIPYIRLCKKDFAFHVNHLLGFYAEKYKNDKKKNQNALCCSCDSTKGKQNFNKRKCLRTKTTQNRIEECFMKIFCQL